MLLADEGQFDCVGWALAKMGLKTKKIPEKALFRLGVVFGGALFKDVRSVAATEAAEKVGREAADVTGGGIDGEDWVGAGAVAAHGFFGRGDEGRGRSSSGGTQRCR